MVNCHFVDILKTLNPNELPRFRDFLDSPFFNKRKKIVKLFDVMKDYYPFFTDINFTRESIFEKVYPGEQFNYAKINEGLSALYKLSLNYIKQVANENNRIFCDIPFLEELRKRSLKNIFALQSKDIYLKINNFEDLDSNVFLKQYLVQIEKINFGILFEKNNRKEFVQNHLAELNKTAVPLTNFFIAELISVSVNSFNYSRIFSNENYNIFEKVHQHGLIAQLFEIIKPYNKYDTYLNLLGCYFEAVYDLKNKDKYYEYKRKVLEHTKEMSVDDLSYHLNCLKSYCMIQKKSVEFGEEFSKEYLNLQEAILERNLFANSKSEFFLKEQYLNMLVNYDAFKDKNKFKSLLVYSKYVHPDFRDDMINLTEAYYYFHSFSYEKVFAKLKKIQSLDKTYEEKIHALTIRSLYELGKFVEALDQISLFKKQLRSNKFISKKKIDNELRFLTTVEKLIKLKEKNENNLEAELIKNKIGKDDLIPNREWLVEKCYELYEKPKQAYQY